MTWIKSIKSSYDSDTKAVKWLHHWFPSVHVNKSLLQESTGRCYDTVKHDGNKMWGHCKIFHNRQHKIQKKICINRHIIKYYVITEHILIHGVAMEIGFGEWEMIPLIQALPLWPFIASHYLLNLSIARASSTYPHSPSKKQKRTAVSRETRAKNIRLLNQKGRHKWQRFLFTLQVFTTFVAKV